MQIGSMVPEMNNKQFAAPINVTNGMPIAVGARDVLELGRHHLGGRNKRDGTRLPE